VAVFETFQQSLAMPKIQQRNFNALLDPGSLAPLGPQEATVSKKSSAATIPDRNYDPQSNAMPFFIKPVTNKFQNSCVGN
jgi:hypothetical protein